MASRSRKRRRPAAAREQATRPAREPAADPIEPAAPEPDSPASTLRRGYARGRERDNVIRADLQPLAPGERPRPITIAAIVALGFAIANAVATLTGNAISGQQNAAAQSILTTALLVVAGAGMLARQYWAVLGFQAILVLQILGLSLALVRVQKPLLAIGIVILIGLLGWLFWKLIRAMARLQVPARPDAGPPREPTR